MNSVEFFDRVFRRKEEQTYLWRHLKGWRGRLVILILGRKRIDNLMYDCAQQGWGYKSNYDWHLHAAD